MKIGIIGTGFVGLSLAAVLGSLKFKVLAIDSDLEKIKKIKEGITPFYEPDLEPLLKKGLDYLEVSSSIEKGVNECDFIFICVGTPIGKNGEIDLSNIKKVAKKIGMSLVISKNNPIIIIKSTVVPGTNQIIKNLITKNSRKTPGKHFGLVSNPEFLREGKAIEDTLKPHILVIGGENKVDVNKVKKMYKKIFPKNIPTITTNPQTAEMIKYANNSFLATKISFINQISNICQSIPGTNIDDISKAIGIDPRIGNQFLNAGPGFGGSCLPKDLQALISFSKQIGTSSIFLKAIQKTNNLQVENLLNMIKEMLTNLKDRKITILGLSFKENTDDIRESVSIKLIKKLISNKSKIIVHDPMAIENTRRIFQDKIEYTDSIKNAISGSECVVVMTGWEDYTKLKENDFQSMKKKNVIDTRRILSKKKLSVNYLTLGIGE